MDCFICALVEISMGRMLGVKTLLPGVGGGFEMFSGVPGDFELHEEKESPLTLVLDLHWPSEVKLSGKDELS